MKKSNKLMLRLILLSYFGAFLGAYFKVTGHPNADFVLFIAMIFKALGIAGLFYFNRIRFVGLLK